MSGGPAPLAGRPTLLQQAAAQGNVTLLSMLLNEEGLDTNYSCEDGHSALYSAATNGHAGKTSRLSPLHLYTQKDGQAKPSLPLSGTNINLDFSIILVVEKFFFKVFIYLKVRVMGDCGWEKFERERFSIF